MVNYCSICYIKNRHFVATYFIELSYSMNAGNSLGLMSQTLESKLNDA